jgi:hypothetical protein
MILPSRFKRLAKIAVAFSFFCAVFFLSGCDDLSAPRGTPVPKSSENMRVTSPNGQLDAVLFTDSYGPAAGGGVDSIVYLVRKGNPVYMKDGGEVFDADPMTCGELVWKRDNLLEIHYDIANIHAFRNLWGLTELGSTGNTVDRDVEIRLMPASDSSALTPDGSFRSPGYQSDLQNCYGKK